MVHNGKDIKKYDVAIIGNGILGLSTAFFLYKKNPHLKIAVIGKSERTGSATMAAGAMFNCFSEVTQQTFLSPYSRAKFDMAVQAAKRWPEFLSALDHKTVNYDQMSCGSFLILNSHNGGLDDENFVAIQRALKEQQVEFQEINPADIQGLDPVFDYRPLRALHIPQEGFSNPIDIVNSLEKFLHLKGCQLVNALASQIKQHKQAGFSIQLSDGLTVQSQHVVIAAGAYSQQFIKQFPELVWRIPRVLSSVGCAMVVRSQDIELSGVIRTPNRAGSCGLHILPYRDNLIYVGSTAYFSMEPQLQIKMRYLYNLQKNIIHQFNKNFENMFIEKIVVGNRPVTIDTFPLVGKTSITGLWILTGTYRDGFHDAPILCDYLAGQILGEEPSIENPFLPERKPLELLNKQGSIEMVTKHLFASIFDYGITFPISGLKIEEAINDSFRQRLSEIYQILDTNIGIPIEMLVLLLRESDQTLQEFKSIYHQF